MRLLLPLPVLACLFGAGASMAFGRQRNAQRAIGTIALSTALVAAVAILRHTDAHGTAIAHMGGWDAPMGIALVADRLSGLMAVVSAVVLLAEVQHAPRQGAGHREAETGEEGFLHGGLPDGC